MTSKALLSLIEDKFKSAKFMYEQCVKMKFYGDAKEYKRVLDTLYSIIQIATNYKKGLK